MFNLTKILPVFVYPVGLSLMLGLAGLAALTLRRSRAALLLVSLSLALLWAASAPALTGPLVRSLESRHGQAASLPAASAIVVLGGGEVPPIAPRLYPEITDAGDRLLHGARLYHQGLAPYVVTTGGKDPFGSYAGPWARVSADILAASLNVPPSAILMEERARNTYEHVPGVRELLERRGLAAEIILVTSALHMPRSVAVFEARGFTVHPAPTDFQAHAKRPFSVRTLLPTAASLELTTKAVHEYYGLIVYQLLGRI